MRTLFLECNMGAAGDMLTAALLELLPDRSVFLDRMNALGLEGVQISAEPHIKLGISGTQMHVVIHGEEEESLDVLSRHHEHGGSAHHAHHGDHEDHTHHHGTAHSHHHTGAAEIAETIQALPVSDRVKSNALAVYHLIAEAESHAHGKPVSEIHFHEVGAKDAIADIVGVSLLLEMLHPEKIVVSPVHVGSGFVRCAHGVLPVPAPATAHILRGVPSFGGEIEGELCTPTGAALLRHFADTFSTMPVMRTEAVGIGFGRKDYECLNCVRAFFGESEGASEQITELRCNVDDMTGEELGFAQEMLLDAGAREVFTVPVTMKKSRPGIMLVCLCTEEQRPEMLRLIFRYTSTIGVRAEICERYTMRRSIREQKTPFGVVRIKSAQGFGAERIKPEYDDIAGIAKEHGMTLQEVRDALRDDPAYRE